VNTKDLLPAALVSTGAIPAARPKVAPKATPTQDDFASQAGPDAAYAAAAHTLAIWLEAGILVRDAKPALYAYQQTYTYAGVTYKRRGMFTRVRLEEFSTGGAA